MKITSLEILKVPPSWVWLKVHTDEGIYGLGEPYLEHHPEAVIAEVRRLEPILIGRDPTRVESLWKEMYEWVYAYKGGPVTMSAISGIDMALWDLAGKAAGLPVHRMLGGPTRERVRLYAAAPYVPSDHEPGLSLSLDGPPSGNPGASITDETIREAVEGARQLVAYGYNALKFFPAVGDSLAAIKEVPRVAELFEAVREAVGPDVDLMADLCHPHPVVARQLIEALAPYRCLFIEDPQPTEQSEVVEAICRSTSQAIAACAGWIGKWDFAAAVRAGVTVLQPDLCHVGGITEARKVAAIGEAAWCTVAPHTPNSIVQLMASLQLDACIPNFLIQEHNPVNVRRRGGETVIGVGYLAEPLVLGDDSCVPVPSAPGLGIELNEASLEEIMRKPWRPTRA